MSAQPVTRDEIEAKLREIRGEVEEATERATGYLVAAGVAGAVVLLGTAYWLGRRRGRKRSTVVEVRRV